MIELTVPAMSCGHCVQTVTRAVRKLDPAAQVNVDLASHKVQIESTRPVDEIRTALAQEGYAPAP